MESDLHRRGAAAVESIPTERQALFCAACAERFYAGYARWDTAEESPAVPRATLLRRAIDLCWRDEPSSGELVAANRELRAATEMEEQVLFTSHLSIYNVDLWLVLEALAARREPAPGHALRCSQYAIDFYVELRNLRLELAGGPAAAESEEPDAESLALADVDRQVADAKMLRSPKFESAALRVHSAELGERVLGEVLKQLA